MKLQFTTANELRKQFPHLFPTRADAAKWIKENQDHIAASVLDVLEDMGYEGSIFWDDRSDFPTLDPKDAIYFEKEYALTIGWKEEN